MRVVDRKTFLRLPAGTIYAKGVQWAFEEICIKGDSLENDWYYLCMSWPSAFDCGEAIDLLDKSLKDGSSFPAEDAQGRDGFFDDDAVFLVFEGPDLIALRGFVDRAIELARA